MLRVAVPAHGREQWRRVARAVPADQGSRGITYQVDVRHVHMAEGPAIDLAVTRDDALRAGRLFADGREQWGDLVFETSSRRATLPYWMHEVLRPWPAWVRAWPPIALGLLTFNVVLAWACALRRRPDRAVAMSMPVRAAPRSAGGIRGAPGVCALADGPSASSPSPAWSWRRVRPAATGRSI